MKRLIAGIVLAILTGIFWWLCYEPSSSNWIIRNDVFATVGHFCCFATIILIGSWGLELGTSNNDVEGS